MNARHLVLTKEWAAISRFGANFSFRNDKRDKRTAADQPERCVAHDVSSYRSRPVRTLFSLVARSRSVRTSSWPLPTEVHL